MRYGPDAPTARTWPEAVSRRPRRRTPGPRALRTKAGAWPAGQPHPGWVKLGQNFQGSIPIFQGGYVASGLAVEAGLLLTAGLLEGQREDPRHE
jgi:hypothetical protein